MNLIVVIIVSLLLSLSLRKYECQATKKPTKEDRDLEKTLKMLNKQPVTSIMDEVGALYDCIRMYEQPSLDHPLLKNHKVQMKPTSVPGGFTSGVSLKGKQLMSMLKPIRCPKGTVPIRRTQKEDLIRVLAFTKSYANASLNGGRPHDQHAGVRKITDRNMFYGSQVNMNIINPKLEDDQVSLALTSIWSETEKDINIIQAGWAAAPTLYGDYNTRFITYWRGATGGCFNILCPGFVQVDRNFPVDMLLNSSIYHQRPFEMQVQVILDRNTLNWWLVLPTLYVKVGYWPVSLIPRIHNGAANISWGGFARPSTSSAISPPMGFGTFPDKSDMYNSGYFTNVLVDYQKEKASPDTSWESVSSNWDCYGVTFDFDKDTNLFKVFYGGPGGKC